jgi:hypothetical protein
LVMAIPGWSCYAYHTVLHADHNGDWAGVVDEDRSASLLGSRPSVVVTSGRVTMTRRWHAILNRSQASRASFDGGEALRAVLRQGDRLACWRDGTAEIGLSVTRRGSLVLGLGALGHTPGGDITIDHDPRVEEGELACSVRYIDRPGTHIVWLDPDRSSELEGHLRELDGDLTGVNVLAIVVRTDDAAVSLELNRRTMGRHRSGLGATVFLTAEERFSDVEEWLQYGRALSTERPRDVWLRVRIGKRECLVPEGTTATVDGWLVHVLRVYEPGMPGRLSQVGLVPADAGVTPAMLECSTAAVASGLTLG